ncbi:hypothetical protein AB833_15055 [Chromatiales bacterium (ex Bugula neritina AB1)]|nr:hypothetical protein AB833_15055 [Chromatiales bacterium (ex Bugula neritina AB1)]
MPVSENSVVVIGGGIIGLTSALHLAKLGYGVSLIDPGNISERASTATAGLIGGSAVIPWVSAKLWRELPRMLLDRQSALQMSLPLPRGLPAYIAHCYKAGKPIARERSADGLAGLSLIGYQCWMELLNGCQPGLDLFRQDGCGFLYLSDQAAVDDESNNQVRERLGMQLQRLGSEQTIERIPALSIRLSGSVHVVKAGHVTDPVELQQQLSIIIKELGGRFVTSRVNGFSIKGGQVVGVRTDSGEYKACYFVIAAGTGSQTLAAKLNCKIPLIAGFGSGLVLEQPNVKLQAPFLVLNEGFAVVPGYSGGQNSLRVAGLVAIGAAKHPLQCQLLLQRVKRLFTDLKYKSISSSSGPRPLTPDSLPLISRVPGYDNVILNCGHGHWGLTHAAGSAVLTGNILTGSQPMIDATPYRADRFH